MLSVAVNQPTSNSSLVVEPVEIVMIDDDRSEHLLMATAAREAKLFANFTFYEDGAEALLNLVGVEKADAPDLIVLDLRMPGFDGHSTLDELQADPVLSKVPVVVFTSSPLSSDRFESIDRGAISCVMKPSDFDTMVAIASDFRRLARSGPLPELLPKQSASRDSRRQPIESLGGVIEEYLDKLTSSAPSD